MLNKKTFLTFVTACLILMIGGLLFAFPSFAEEAGGTCSGAMTSSSENVTAPNGAGLISDSTLMAMKIFMHKIYVSLSQVFMVGHALCCYATNVDIIKIFGIKIYNFNMLFAGIAVYFTAAMMTMSIGMYFVDISFKLGFAVLFMPVSIALWPFPPTKNKFGDNLSIIIRNSMLFILVAIGVAFSVTLIHNGLFFNGVAEKGANLSGSAQQAFWNAIANGSTAEISSQYSLDTMNVLILAFSLVFGLKILQSSVNDYLNSLFDDAAFGGQSPMNRMGTQAVAFAKASVVAPVASYAKDVAKATTGRAIGGVGKGISMISNKSGRRQIADTISGVGRKAATFVRNPFSSTRSAYNKQMQKLGTKADKAVKNIISEAVDTAAVLTLASDERRNNWNTKTEGFAQKAGNFVGEQMIAKGGRNLRDNAIKGSVGLYNTAARATGHANMQTTDQEVKDAIKETALDIKYATQNIIRQTPDAMAHATAQTINAVAATAGKHSNISGDDVKGAIHTAGDKIKQGATAAGGAVLATAETLDNTKVGSVAKEFAQGVHEAVKEETVIKPEETNAQIVNEAQNNILRPSKIVTNTLSAPFLGIAHPVKTVRKIAEITTDAASAAAQAKQDRIIIKQTGKQSAKLIMRVAQGTGTDVGGLLQGFGKYLSNNKKSEDNRNFYDHWQQIQAEEQAKKEATEEQRENDRTITDYDS
ncbi:MAG: hypothetical protein ILA52_02625 [Alphaproteobacteria bacterium]|nr:hypothetical protein [Alphaproteobacteria bacterium]